MNSIIEDADNIIQDADEYEEYEDEEEDINGQDPFDFMGENVIITLCSFLFIQVSSFLDFLIINVSALLSVVEFVALISSYV